MGYRRWLGCVGAKGGVARWQQIRMCRLPCHGLLGLFGRLGVLRGLELALGLLSFSVLSVLCRVGWCGGFSFSVGLVLRSAPPRLVSSLAFGRWFVGLVVWRYLSFLFLLLLLLLVAGSCELLLLIVFRYGLSFCLLVLLVLAVDFGLGICLG